VASRASWGGDWTEWHAARKATTAFRSRERITVTYHETEVFNYNPQIGRATLRDGGWLRDKHVMTATRINDAATLLGLDLSVGRTAWEWYVSSGGKSFPFVDGMNVPTRVRWYEAEPGIKVAFLHSDGRWHLDIYGAEHSSVDTWGEAYEMAREIAARNINTNRKIAK